jgi:hypothetical protein
VLTDLAELIDGRDDRRARRRQALTEPATMTPRRSSAPSTRAATR